MKIINCILFIILACQITFGQSKTEKETSKIVEEGRMLYKSEMASWFGTDIFIEKYKEKEKIGGYLSYSENDISRCIFYSKGEKPKVIGTMDFDLTFKIENAKTELSERELTKTEFDLFEMKTIALKIVNSDTIFKRYENSNLNLIPIINGKERKVYVLTGPKKNGVMIFGNDYLLTFDQNNKLVNRKQLHRNIIPIEFGGKNEIGETMHSHRPETGDFITSTDICTLMLYAKFAKMKQHYVISKNYVSIWDCEKEILAVMTMKAWKKIGKYVEKNKKE
ncbi:hypothetical protein LIS90_11910 [Flavobacterium psychrophilum]|uniref:hypothetical protein n=1 Tax=Flavobacterium psychrophilum TaxID=96345 RepID=UPI00106C9C9F|nr:hypothetical protein [Flavobacterium psychrophilum]MCB6089696.1 hypothetical protein [Flavobacterium psychrophilum]MCB6231953.1 hypothetical protein [Flavobacterium psychrophilum]